MCNTCKASRMMGMTSTACNGNSSEPYPTPMKNTTALKECAKCNGTGLKAVECPDGKTGCLVYHSEPCDCGTKYPISTIIGKHSTSARQAITIIDKVKAANDISKAVEKVRGILTAEEIALILDYCKVPF